MKKFIFLIAVVLSQTVTALDINNTAGGLGTSIGDDTSISTLTVTGTINAADFDFISNNLKNLTTLDLSGTTVTAYEGEAILTGRSVYPAGQIPPFALFGSNLTHIDLPSSTERIGEGAFASTAITSMTIPESVTEIDNSAFAGCRYLKSITVPNTVKILGNNMFSGCQALESAAIYSSTDSIGKRMFAGCLSLSEITLQPSVRSIAKESFTGCAALKEFIFPESLNIIGERAFYGSGLEKINLTECTGLKNIGDFSFAKCLSLTSANINEGLEVLGKGVFFDDCSLVTVTLPASTSIIPEFTFKGTTSIDPDMAVPHSVNEIGNYALTGWEHVKEFNAPDGLEFIGDNAMEGWKSLETFNAFITHTVPELGENVWNNVNQADAILYVANSNMAEEFGSDPQWGKFNIQLKTDGIEQINDEKETDSVISFMFENGNLIIISKGSPVTETVIYDIEGRRRLSKSSTGNRVEIDGSALGRGILIARVTLENGGMATLKISRR